MLLPLVFMAEMSGRTSVGGVYLPCGKDREGGMPAGATLARAWLVNAAIFWGYTATESLLLGSETPA